MKNATSPAQCGFSLSARIVFSTMWSFASSRLPRVTKNSSRLMSRCCTITSAGITYTSRSRTSIWLRNCALQRPNRCAQRSRTLPYWNDATFMRMLLLSVVSTLLSSSCRFEFWNSKYARSRACSPSGSSRALQYSSSAISCLRNASARSSLRTR